LTYILPLTPVWFGSALFTGVYLFTWSVINATIPLWLFFHRRLSLEILPYRGLEKVISFLSGSLPPKSEEVFLMTGVRFFQMWFCFFSLSSCNQPTFLFFQLCLFFVFQMKDSSVAFPSELFLPIAMKVPFSDIDYLHKLLSSPPSWLLFGQHVNKWEHFADSSWIFQNDSDPHRWTPSPISILFLFPSLPPRVLLKSKDKWNLLVPFFFGVPLYWKLQVLENARENDLVPPFLTKLTNFRVPSVLLRMTHSLLVIQFPPPPLVSPLKSALEETALCQVMTLSQTIPNVKLLPVF